MALDGVVDEDHIPATLTQRKRLGTYFREEWSVWTNVEKIIWYYRGSKPEMLIP
jgi:hypothetical protein